MDTDPALDPDRQARMWVQMRKNDPDPQHGRNENGFRAKRLTFYRFFDFYTAHSQVS